MHAVYCTIIDAFHLVHYPARVDATVEIRAQMRTCSRGPGVRALWTEAKVHSQESGLI